ELDRALVSGLAWTAAARWSAQLVSWLATFYAAHILAPSDYGLVGMATVAIGLARMVEDFGLDSILLQDRTIDGDRRAHVAGFLLAFSGFLTVLFALLAHPVSLFFKEPAVAGIVAALSVLFVTD